MGAKATGVGVEVLWNFQHVSILILSIWKGAGPTNGAKSGVNPEGFFLTATSIIQPSKPENFVDSGANLNLYLNKQNS